MVRVLLLRHAKTGHNARDNSRPAGHGGQSRRVDADRRVARDVTKKDDDDAKKYSEDFLRRIYGDVRRRLEE